MLEKNDQYLPEDPENNLNDTESNMNTDNSLIALTSADVAKRLGISVKSALRLMHKLPHANVSRNLGSTRQHLRISQETLEKYLSRKAESKESLNNDSE